MLSCIIYNVTSNKREQQHPHWMIFSGTSFQLILSGNNGSGFILYELYFVIELPIMGKAAYSKIFFKT